MRGEQGLLLGREPVEIFLELIKARKAPQKAHGRLRAHFRDAGDVVRRVAGHGLKIRPLIRLEARLLHKSFAGDELLLTLGGVPHDHVLIQALPQILVRADNDHAAVFLETGGQGGDAVVGLSTFGFKHANAQKPEPSLQGFELRGKSFGHAGPIGLVGGQKLVPEGGGAAVGDENEVGRVLFAQEFQDQLEDDIHGAGRKPVGALEIGIGVKTAIDEGVAVDQKKAARF